MDNNEYDKNDLLLFRSNLAGKYNTFKLMQIQMQNLRLINAYHNIITYNKVSWVNSKFD